MLGRELADAARARAAAAASWTCRPHPQRPTRLSPSPPRLALPLLLALASLLLVPPGAQRPFLLLAGAVPDGTGDLSAGPAAAPSCTQPLCYSGLVDNAKASCKAHEYDPGLFQMFTDTATRQAAQVSPGDRVRLLAALTRFRDGGNLTVAVVGGSIAAGQGAHDAPSFPKWMRFILEAQMPGGPARLKINNGAVPGTSSQYMSACHNVHVPRDADVVFVEYAVNDEEMPMPHMNNQVRRPYERLIRKLLTYPRRPAVILMHAFRWFQLPTDNTGKYWASSERQHHEFGLYYGLPQVSVKAACYHHMVAGKDGYQVKRPRADPHGKLQIEGLIDASLKGKAFYFDIVHPDGHTGHRIMGEFAAQVVLDAWAQVASGYSPSAEDLARVAGPLPPPMLPGNFESTSDKCFIGPAFQRTVVHTDGFEWVNEGKQPAMPKWGYIADVPGKEIRFRISTKTTSDAQKEGARVTVELGYLKSYENMGRADVSCGGGCACDPWTLDGIQEARNSQSFLHAFPVTQADECIITVRVIDATTSGKHKVKLTGIMISEEPEGNGFQNWAAWDWVALAAAKDPAGVFEIGNIARRSLLSAFEASSAELQRSYHAQLQQVAADIGAAAAAAAGAGAGAGTERK